MKGSSPCIANLSDQRIAEPRVYSHERQRAGRSTDIYPRPKTLASILFHPEDEVYVQHQLNDTPWCLGSSRHRGAVTGELGLMSPPEILAVVASSVGSFRSDRSWELLHEENRDFNPKDRPPLTHRRKTR